MATQVYQCRLHGDFEVRLPTNAAVPESYPCPALLGLTTIQCMREATWVPSAPGIVYGPSWGPRGGQG